MIRFSPAAYRPFIGQRAAPMVSPSASPPTVLSSGLDPLYTGYTGLSGFIETVTVLAVLGSAAWIGISTGLDKGASKPKKIAGWIGGVGTGLVALLYLGGKSGYGPGVGLPAVRVSPS